MSKLGERLRTLKEERGLTNLQIAQETGLSRSAIAEWVNGRRMPNSYALTVLCKYFKVSADWLLGLSGFRKIR